MKRVLLYLVPAMLGVLLLADRARAHAFLDHAEPSVGATIAASPAEVKIWFTNELDPAGSCICVLNAHGDQVDAKDTHIDGKDATLMSVSLKKLSPGEYTVKWSAMSVDSHKTDGNFKFTVK